MSAAHTVPHTRILLGLVGGAVIGCAGERARPERHAAGGRRSRGVDSITSPSPSATSS